MMSVRRDPITGHWFFRTRVTYPDGSRGRIFGTPGVSGPWHELPQTRLGAVEAEQRAIMTARGGRDIRPTPAKEVPTINEYAVPFMDFYAAAHKPSSKRDKRQRLDAYILPTLGHLRLDQLRQEHVDGLVADLLARERNGRKGINTTLSVLSSLVGYAVTNKVIADPGLSYTVKVQDGELVAVAPDDVSRLEVAAGDARYRAAILLAADAGLRVGEIRALPWLDVNEIGRELAIAWSYDRTNALSETKGWERRTIPISDRLWSAMKALDRAGPLVFARRDGKPLGYDAVRDVLHEIYKRAGVVAPKMPWHALRHTFGTELARAGADIQTIRELMGHKSIETTMRYLHTTRDRKRSAISGLSSLGSGWAVASEPESK